MLRSREARSLTSILTQISSDALWTRYKFSSSTKFPAQKGATEEELITKTLLQTSDSAFIRTWTFPRSMRDALAIIRAVERKYGLIKEFKYLRDFEVPSDYQLMIKIAFRDPKSQKRIPEEAEELRVVLPPAVPDDQPGGIGLADLEEYLSSTESPLKLAPESDTASKLKLDNVMASILKETQAREEYENAERVITCRIHRARFPFYTPSYVAHYWSRRQERDAIARQFLNWGGFHDFPPIESNTSLPDKDFFGSPKIEHFRMRRCLRRASKYLEVPNPYEYSPEHVPGSVACTEEVSEDDWEPLSSSPASQSDHVLYATLEETQEMETLKRNRLLGSFPPQQKDDVLCTTPEQVEALKESVEVDDNVHSIATPPSRSSDASLGSETSELSNQFFANVAEPSLVASSSSSQQRHSNELDEQLRAARLLARQVAEEQRKHAKHKVAPSMEVPNEDATMEAKDSLLEEDVSCSVANRSGADVDPLRPATIEKRAQSHQEEEGSVAGKLKNAWKGLF